MRLLTFLLVVSIFLNSCLSTAKISDLPKSAREINFSQYSNEYHEQKEPFWTAKTSNEYYFEKAKTLEEETLVTMIQEALKEKGYSIKQIDLDSNYIVGKRGMQANEWGSLTAVYYNLSNDSKIIQIYIKTVITQDGTGGWSENRAKKVGVIIEHKIDSNN